MHIENLHKLFVDELKDTYDAEHQLVDALQEMEGAARSPQLKRAFSDHRRQTQGHVQRLERVFRGLGEEPDRKTCKAMKGLISEGQELAEADGDDASVDAGIIGAAQKVEHYEMAAYGTLRTFALTLGREAEARILQETLDEESETDEKLTELAVTTINPEAAEGKGNGNGQGLLAGMLSSLGVRSRSGNGRKGRGSSRTSGGAQTRSSSSSKSSGGSKRGAAAKSGSASRSGSASKRSASSKRGAASKRSASSKSGGSTKRGASTPGRKSAAKKSGSRSRKSSRSKK